MCARDSTILISSLRIRPVLVDSASTLATSGDREPNSPVASARSNAAVRLNFSCPRSSSKASMSGTASETSRISRSIGCRAVTWWRMCVRMAFGISGRLPRRRRSTLRSPRRNHGQMLERHHGAVVERDSSLGRDLPNIVSVQRVQMQHGAETRDVRVDRCEWWIDPIGGDDNSEVVTLDKLFQGTDFIGGQSLRVRDHHNRVGGDVMRDCGDHGSVTRFDSLPYHPRHLGPSAGIGPGDEQAQWRCSQVDVRAKVLR